MSSEKIRIGVCHDARDTPHNRYAFGLTGLTYPKGTAYSVSAGVTETKVAAPCHSFSQWPRKPEILGKTTYITILSSIAEWILVLTPLMFIGLAVSVLLVSGKATADCRAGQRIEAAVKLGPTIFPLVFAAVVSRSLNVFGRYFCHRSTTLGTLEHLLASRSVWSTFESQLLLRRCTVVGAHLLLLWTLSPLGGQATLRAIERTQRVTHSNITLRHLYTGPFSTYMIANESRYLHNYVAFVSVLRAPLEMKTAPRDNWGNVRVPLLEGLPTYAAAAAAAAAAPHSWHPIPPITQPEQFSALTGLPVVGLPARQHDLTTHFTLESSYMTTSCTDAWESFSEGDAARLAKYRNWSRARDPFRHKRGENGTWQNRDSNTTFYFDGDMPYAALDNATAVARDPRPRRLSFVSAHRRGGNDTRYTVSAITCSVAETHVEVAVSCAAGRECRATRMRRSLSDTRPRASSALDFAERRRILFTSLPYLQVNYGELSTPTEAFLHDSAHFREPSRTAAPFVDLARVAPRLFARRLQLVLNAWHQLNLAGDSATIFGDTPLPALEAAAYDFARLPADGRVPQATVDAACRLFCSRSAPATVTRAVEVWGYSRVWLALLFGSAAVLLVTGLAGAGLGVRTRVPDVLGYAASMTYNNRYLPLPEPSRDVDGGESGVGGGGSGGGGVLDAMARARLLWDLRVSVGDVRGDDTVGRIAFTSKADVRALERGRLYT